MTGRAARQLSPLSWLGIPAVAAGLAAVLLAAPIQLGGLRLPEPVFAAAPAFAWALLRPSSAAPFVVLASGLFLDLLWGSPLGLWGGSLLVIYAGGLIGRRFLVGQPGPVLFAWWAGLVTAAFGAAWVLAALDARAMPAPFPVLWQLVATLALYPVAAYLIDRYADEARRL